jgi:prolyl oligopeptidase PreP (S9A serine peptidase family)
MNAIHNPLGSSGEFVWVRRGGGEYGTEWHDQGRGLNKPVAIDDVSLCAEYLIREGWTCAAKLTLLVRH